jgi:hypothetical protein
MFKVRSINNLLATSNTVLQFTMLLVIAAIVHGLVLRFVFPGYYDPLWPIHSDFYLPAEIANSPASIFSYLTWPRPTGMVFFALIGKLGIHGSLAAIIFVAMLNAVITALLIKKFLTVSFGLRFLIIFIVYTFLLFSHPYFYSFYVHDAFSQLSYLLLIMGLFFYCSLLEKSIALATCVLFIFTIVGFLAKETFGGAALVISVIWFLYQRKKSVRDSITPFTLIFVALIITFGFNFLIKSSFVTNSNTAYRVDLNPFSILSEWFHYIKLGYNLGSVLLLILIGFLVFSKKLDENYKPKFVFVGCLLAFCAALLPNSLLPDHQHNGYSWTGAYILLATSFFLAVPNIFFKWGKFSQVTFVSLLILFLTFSQVANFKKYRNSSNQWIIFQENTQRNLLSSLKMLMDELACSKGEKILISGISFPFSPFHNPRSLTPYLRSDKVSFDVVSYASNSNIVIRSEKVRDIPLENVVFSEYSRVWMFGSDGRLVKTLNSKELGYGFELLAPLKNFILFPEVAAALNVEFEPLPNVVSSHDGYKLLQSGNSYLAYQQPLLALEYFQESARNIPDNPYPWYMAGVELEKLNRLDEAKQYFQKAVDLDPKNQNPAFINALTRVQSITGK